MNGRNRLGTDGSIILGRKKEGRHRGGGKTVLNADDASRRPNLRRREK
jgi:hypothetical protein